MRIKAKKYFLIRWGVKLSLLAIMTYSLFNVDSHAIKEVLKSYVPFLIGALMCGWVCPAGFAQDLVFRKNYSIEPSYNVHNYLRLLRYIFLVLAILGIFLIPAQIKAGIIYSVKFETEEILPFVFYLSLTTIFISIFINRFFCRYLCPSGALLGIKSLFRPITINNDKTKCNSCGYCNKICPMKIKMSDSDSSFSPNCLSCFKCIEHCHKKALHIGIRKYKNIFTKIREYYNKRCPTS